MVRFSCFRAHIHDHRPKKVQHHTQEKYSQELLKVSSKVSTDGIPNTIPPSTPSISKDNSILLSTDMEETVNISSVECCWKSDDLKAISYSGDEDEILGNVSLMKSHSLGSELDREGRFSHDMHTDDDIDQRSLLDNIQDKELGGIVNLFDDSGTADACGCDGLGISCNQENMFEINTNPIFSQSFFPIEDIKPLDYGFYGYHVEELPVSDPVDLGRGHISHTFSKSCSLPKLGASESSVGNGTLVHRSRSVGNLSDAEVKTGFSDGEGGYNSRASFDECKEASSCHETSQAYDVIEKRLHWETDFSEQCVAICSSEQYKEMTNKGKELMTEEECHNCAKKNENIAQDCITSVHDWREPEIGSMSCVNIQEESLAERLHNLDCEDFNMKRIKEWICQIDIDNSVVQEVGETSNDPPSMKKDFYLISCADTSKPNVKGGDGVKAAYNYISSLAPAATSAQMANLGLVVIPFLAAFSSLRVLNLSGNAIVRITSGALPKGLHVLNLSRNNISIIEGLRELIRLRVLDLSYNRIFRVGHGLAACSSLKELYLVGNKLSEVEGLHRLLKLNLLDLQFNKISAVKSLGQLAANYGSLQAINLEGNPAQRNVGDDQLKRYLHGLLPRLISYNKHIIRNNPTKDASNRPTRTVTIYQYDRGTRLEPKHTRRGHNTTSSHKVTSSSNHRKISQTVGSLQKIPRHWDQHAHLPIPGSKAYNLPRTSSKIFSGLQTINPMRRSQSEGNI